MFTFPTSRGMTNYKAVKLFKEAIKDKNTQAVKRIYVSSLENNLDAQQLFKSASSAIKADITFDNKKMARELLTEFKSLDPQAREDALQLYIKRGIITPEIFILMNKLEQKQKNIDFQRKLIGIGKK